MANRLPSRNNVEVVDIQTSDRNIVGFKIVQPANQKTRAKHLDTFKNDA